MNKTKTTYTEAELAQHFMAYFSDTDIYPEVEVASGYIDFVCIDKNGKTIAVEVKKVFNFKLLEQGLRSLKHANEVYLCTPRLSDASIKYKLCKDYGLGLLIYDRGHVIEEIKPKYTPVIKKKMMLSAHHKKGVAGSQHARVTAFEITKLNVIAYLKEHNNESDAKTLINNIEHHYSSTQTAITSLRKWCKKGIISEFEFSNKKILLK
ncbi:MAG: hypothetical protein ACRDD8_14775 [Bacteroidales bacterium]